MKLPSGDYIILEIIPTAVNPKDGDIIQLSALKLNGLNLISRFDYRLNEEKILLDDFKRIIDYDKDSFVYVDSSEMILDDFKKYVGELPLLIIDNLYTANYLKDFTNDKESVFKYLDTVYNDHVIEDLVKRYNITFTNHIVDVLYELLIMTNS